MNGHKLRNNLYSDVVGEVIDCLDDTDCGVAFPPTADQCKQLFYEKWGPNEDNNNLVNVGDFMEGAHLYNCVPTWLISDAVAYALSLINWTEIAIRVEEERE
jgi:hypothetical protein